MNSAAKILATVSIVWAVLAPISVVLYNVQDEHERTLRALAAVSLGATAEDMTNAVIRVPRSSVDVIEHLAHQARHRSEFFMTMLLVSSLLTTVSSVLVLSLLRRSPAAS